RLSNGLATNQAKQQGQAKQGGRGLAGLRERAVLLGGTFRAGELDGVWQLSSEFPWKRTGT
ncbi:MAG: hypothetical protein ABI568_06550, partial [Pseudarthrobacter sp.]